MAKSPNLNQYIPPIEIRLRIVQITLPTPTEWEYLSFSLFETDTTKRIFGDVDPETFFLDITPLTKIQNLALELKPSQFVFESEPVGTRGISVSVAEFSRDLPEDKWDNQFGNFQRWTKSIQELIFPACDLDETIVPISRSELSFSGFSVPEKSLAILSVLGRQTSERSLDCLNGEVTMLIGTRARS